MPFQLSPGVAVVEKDFTSIVPAVATSIGATVGAFPWGPVMEPTTVSSENELVRRFGQPNDSNFQSFFTAANFLSYTNNLLLVRADATGLKNAVSTGTAIKIKNAEEYLATYANGQAAVGEFAARYAGAAGNSLLVSMADADTFAGWDYSAEFDFVPGTSSYVAGVGATTAEDELHIIIIDEDGVFSGTAGTVLEKFAFVSKASDAKKSDGTNNYYKDVINSRSQYIYWMDHSTAVETSGAAWGVAATALAGSAYKALSDSLEISLIGGVDDYALSDGNKQTAYALFADAEQYDISLILAGKASTTVATYIINSVAEVRLD
jgi:hypothetical protein